MYPNQRIRALERVVLCIKDNIKSIVMGYVDRFGGLDGFKILAITIDQSI